MDLSVIEVFWLICTDNSGGKMHSSGLTAQHFVLNLLIVFGFILLNTSQVLAGGAKDINWLKEKASGGALAWDHGGLMLIEINTGKSQKVGGGKFAEFSTEGSFLGWNDGGKAMVYARKSGTTKQIASGIKGHVSWINDHEFVVFSGSWKQIDVLNGKESVPDGLLKLTGSAVDGEDDLKMTEKGNWIVLSGTSIKSDEAGAKGSRPGSCAGALSKFGYEVGGLEHSHQNYTIKSVRSGGSSGSISWSIGCGGKGMDNNRFSSTSQEWIVNMNECASSMAVHNVKSNDYVLLGTSAKTSGENYGDFAHKGPTLDFGSPTALLISKANLKKSARASISINSGSLYFIQHDKSQALLINGAVDQIH